MKIKELLENINFALAQEWITPDNEVTIEVWDKKAESKNDSFHVSGWNVYYMLDRTFSLSIDIEEDRFNELEYENLTDAPDPAPYVFQLEYKERLERDGEDAAKEWAMEQLRKLMDEEDE